MSSSSTVSAPLSLLAGPSSFTFKVKSKTVRVTVEDTRRIRTMAVAGFVRARPHELKVAHAGSAEAWVRKVQSLCSHEEALVSKFAESLYRALRGDEAALAVAVSLLSGSRKSEKLAFAFQTVGSAGKRADRAALAKMLNAVLVAVYCSTTLGRTDGRDCDDDSAAKDDSVLRAIKWEAEDLADAIRGGRPAATFDDFGNWYNSVGFESAPWLELLDLSKWPKTTRRPLKKTKKKKLPFSANDDDDDDDDSEDSDTSSFLVTFDAETYPDDEPLGEAPGRLPGALKVQFTAAAVARLRSFAVGSGLFELDAADVCSAILDAAKQTVHILGRPSRPALDADAVAPILANLGNLNLGGGREDASVSPSSSFPERHKRNTTKKHAGLLRTLLSAFRVRSDPSFFGKKRGFVEAQDLAAALTLFCAGSKSSKLAVAWDVLADSSNRLTVRGLWRFVRAFLVVLLVLASCPVPAAHDAAPGTLLPLSPRNDDDETLTTRNHPEATTTTTTTTTNTKEEEDLDDDDDDDDEDSFVETDHAAALSLEAISHLIDDADAAAVTLAARVFADTAPTTLPRTDLSFDDFADWYTDGGFQLASWFELLDLYKWAL